MKIQQNKEEKLLGLLLEGKTLANAVATTIEEFPADKRIIRHKNGYVEVLD
jgi:hypothetical protein